MILVADSEPRRKAALVQLIETKFTEPVQVVGNAHEIVKDVKFSSLRLIILNPRLPSLGKKVVDLIQKIRSNYNELTLPIIILLDEGTVEYEARVLTAGANDVLMVPLNEQTLVARIQRQLRFAELYHREKQMRTNTSLMPVISKSGSVETDPPTRALDQPISYEVPLNLISKSGTLFCKTIWVSYRHLLLRVFEDLPREQSYKIEMPDPEGGQIILDVTQVKREANEEHLAGVFKLSLEITRADEAYDRFFENLYQSQELKTLTEGEPEAPRVEDGTASFNPQDAALNLIKGSRYHFNDNLGRGSFASVYLVNDMALKRPVAMKVLNPEFSKDAETRQNFLNEAQIAAQFHHPNIAFVFEVGELREKDYPRHLNFPKEILQKHPKRMIYFTMQYVEGRTLSRWIDKKQQPEPSCLDLLVQICKALVFAHGKGVIHRDIKPDNIMVTDKDQVIVTDFGIATLAKAQPETPQDPDDAHFEIACTPKYASPEQLTGESVDTRSDIYSFGIVAYELLAGTAPFSGRSLTEIAHKQLVQSARPLTEVRPEMSTRLEEIIFRCIEKSPEERYQNSEEVLVALLELKGSKEEVETNSMKALDALLSQMIVAERPKEAAMVMERVIAYVNLRHTHDDVDELRQIHQRLTDPSMINVLIEKNLNEDNLHLLYQFFTALESASAVPKILRWFQTERQEKRKEFLGQLAILCAGEELMPLVAFGLELGDNDARILLRAFSETASHTSQPIFLKWALHGGYQTQKELLKIIATTKRSDFEVNGILEYLSGEKGSMHREIRKMAEKLLQERRDY